MALYKPLPKALKRVPQRVTLMPWAESKLSDELSDICPVD